MFEEIKRFGQKLTAESHMTGQQKLESSVRAEYINTLKALGVPMSELINRPESYTIDVEDISDEVGSRKEDILDFEKGKQELSHYKCYRYKGKIDNVDVYLEVVTTGEKLENVIVRKAFLDGREIVDQKEAMELYKKVDAIYYLSIDGLNHYDSEGNYTP